MLRMSFNLLLVQISHKPFDLSEEDHYLLDKDAIHGKICSIVAELRTDPEHVYDGTSEEKEMRLSLRQKKLVMK